VGYIQSYPLKNNPWEGQDLPEKIILDAAGFDLFLGDANVLRKGLGYQVVNLFLEKYIWPHYRYCLTDPDVRNEASIRLFQKCGFIEHKKIPYLDALKQRTQLQLFIKKR
jgi:aminoglycoside 6'-N-acetyltransferase